MVIKSSQGECLVIDLKYWFILAQNKDKNAFF